MTRTTRSSLILFLLAVSLIPLAFACEAFAPTPSPTPTPPPISTPTPEPTPESTAVERLAWFDARPDTAHWIAWNALRRMAIDDEPLTQQIASLGWVADGITAEEAGALDDVSWLLREHPAIADTALSLPWMATSGVIAPDDRRALRAIRAAASTDENLGATLAGYGWLTDGLSQDEAEALETLGEIVSPGFITQTATGIGAIRLDRAGIGTPSSISPRQLQLAASFSQLPWMQDDVTSLETVFIANLIELTETAGSIHADAADTILSYGWVQDGVELYEPRLLLPYGPLFKAAGVEDADILPIMLEYEWIADGLRSDEARSISRLTSLLGASSSDDADITRTMVSYQWLTDSIDGSEYTLLDEFPYLLRLEESAGTGHRQTILEYDWLADNITPEETVAFGTLTTITEQYDDKTDDFITVLIASPWLRDEVQEKENRLLDEYDRYLTYGRVPNATVPSRLATYAWLNDGVSDIEFEYVLAALNLLRDVSPTAPETVAAVIENSSADPTSLEDVMTAFGGFRDVINVSNSMYEGGLTRDVTGMPWLLDGIEPLEGWWFSEYTWLLRELDGENEELARSLLSRPWARDGISADEREWTHQYRRLLEETTGMNRENALKLADLPWFQEQIDFLAAGIIGRLAFAALHNRSLVIEDEWPDDGISESDLVLLLALFDARARSEYEYRDLQEQSNIARRTLKLPLAGDVELYVVRHTPFPDDDPTLDLMEQIIVHLEEFMGVAFPRNPSITLIIEPSTRAGETPQFGVAHAALSHAVISAPRHNPDFHLAVFHEMSHMYWGGYTRAPIWWNEGAAGFLPDYARDALGHESLSIRRSNLLEDTKRECWDRGIDNISDYYHAQKVNSIFAADRGICVYAFGELFLMEMYLLLGHDATSTAMRQLYLDARDSHWFNEVTDQKIYDAFRANTPEDKVEDFRKLFLRLHGGARVDLSESAT